MRDVNVFRRAKGSSGLPKNIFKKAPLSLRGSRDRSIGELSAVFRALFCPILNYPSFCRSVRCPRGKYVAYVLEILSFTSLPGVARIYLDEFLRLRSFRVLLAFISDLKLCGLSCSARVRISHKVACIRLL